MLAPQEAPGRVDLVAEIDLGRSAAGEPCAGPAATDAGPGLPVRGPSGTSSRAPGSPVRAWSAPRVYGRQMQQRREGFHAAHTCVPTAKACSRYADAQSRTPPTLSLDAQLHLNLLASVLRLGVG